MTGLEILISTLYLTHDLIPIRGGYLRSSVLREEHHLPLRSWSSGTETLLDHLGIGKSPPQIFDCRRATCHFGQRPGIQEMTLLRFLDAPVSSTGQAYQVRHDGKFEYDCRC